MLQEKQLPALQPAAVIFIGIHTITKNFLLPKDMQAEIQPLATKYL
jgi:hypothetical protein